MKKKKFAIISTFLFTIILTSLTTVYAVKAVQSNTVSYDNTTSGLTSTNVKDALDELYRKQKAVYNKIPLATYLRLLPTSDTVVQDDASGDENMRYIGISPNNYVTFNGENAGWRVIGVFDENSHGIKGNLVKIQKTTYITTMKWNTSNGKNGWYGSDVKGTLNEGEYYTTTLTDAAKEMIQTVNWKLGAIDWTNENMFAQKFYDAERGNVGAGYEPTKLSWSGDVALAYVSDYVYSTSGGTINNRKTCLEDRLRTKDSSYTVVLWRSNAPIGECVSNSWMIKPVIDNSTNHWTLSQQSDTTVSLYGIWSYQQGVVRGPAANETHGVVPSVYLKPNVICTNCSESDAGTSENPFELSIS